MWLTIVFALFVLLDLGLIGLFFLLGLAFSGSTHSSSLEVVFKLLVIPLGVLVFAGFLFFITRSTVLRLIAILISAAPFLYFGGGIAASKFWAATYVDSDGVRVHFRSGPLRELEYSIIRNDRAAFTRLLRQVNVNELGEDGSTLLMIAMRQIKAPPDHLYFLDGLLAAKADPNAGRGESPLRTAVYKSKVVGVDPFLKLLDHGARLNETGEFLKHPLYFRLVGHGAHPELLAIGLERGIDIHFQTAEGQTMLSEAVQVQNWPAALVLLERGAKPDGLKMPNGKPLLEAVRQSPAGQPGLAELQLALGVQP